MWPFKPKESLDDNTEFIHLGQRVYPLSCNEALYEKYLNHIRNTFRFWFNSEITLANDTNQDLEHHVIMHLRFLNVKMLAHEIGRNHLTRILSDTAINKTGDRFFDVILLINMTTPQEVMDTITGRFLASVLYYLPKTVDDQRLPDKEEWLSLLIEHKWIPLLPIYQSIFDDDDLIKKITKLINLTRANQTHSVSVNSVPGTSPT